MMLQAMHCYQRSTDTLCLQVRSCIAGENVPFCCCGPCLAIGKMDDNQNLELPAKVWANFSMMQILQT